MLWAELKRNWRDHRALVKARWARLSDRDLDAIGGRRAILVAMLKDYYAVRQEDAEQQIEEFLQHFRRAVAR